MSESGNSQKMAIGNIHASQVMRAWPDGGRAVGRTPAAAQYSTSKVILYSALADEGRRCK